jgi:hypothetical protein
MISNIVIELLLHWLCFLPGLIIFAVMLCSISLLNIFLWIPLLIYFIYIQVKLPSFKEIEYWEELRKSIGDSIYLKSEKYTKVFQAEFESNSCHNHLRPRVLLWHPHGIQVISHIIHKLCMKSPLFNFLKDTKTTVHSMTFQIPIIREIFLFYGCIPATKEYITHYLEKGQSISIFPGGVKEMKYCNSDNPQNICYLKNRKGYLEIGKDYDFVPIYTLGEQGFFSSNKDSIYKRIINSINKICSAICGYSSDISALELFNWKSFWKWNKVYFGLEDSHTYTFVGDPIKTDKSDEYIDNLQRIYKLVQQREKSDKSLIVE